MKMQMQYLLLRNSFIFMLGAISYLLSGVVGYAQCRSHNDGEISTPILDAFTTIYHNNFFKYS